jgi:hypothetical protein
VLLHAPSPKIQSIRSARRLWGRWWLRLMKPLWSHPISRWPWPWQRNMLWRWLGHLPRKTRLWSWFQHLADFFSYRPRIEQPAPGSWCGVGVWRHQSSVQAVRGLGEPLSWSGFFWRAALGRHLLLSCFWHSGFFYSLFSFPSFFYRRILSLGITLAFLA